MSVTCTRAWYATWTHCGCPPCLRSTRLQRKLVATGRAQRTTSAAAWVALDRMLANDWTIAAIASACTLSRHGVNAIVQEVNHGHRRVIGAVIAHRITNHGTPTSGCVGATGARRKTQALARLGHAQSDIAAAADLPFWTSIAKIQRGETRRITPRVAEAIDQAWKTLARTPGHSQAATERAIAAGWCGVGAWDDIDDPNEKPKGLIERVEREVA